MADATVGKKRRATFSNALKEVGVLPLTLVSVGGGLSIVDILERLVFGEVTLLTPFRMVLNGYHRITELLGALVEPLLLPALQWFNTQWNWHLELNSIWRSLFVLGMITSLGFARALWFDNSKGDAITALLISTLCVTVGAMLASLAPLSVWWGQGLLAGVSVTALVFSFGLLQASREYETLVAATVAEISIREAVAQGAGAFGLASGLALSSILADESGVLTVLVFVLWRGFSNLYAGWRYNYSINAKAGLFICGGFAAAGLVIGSSWAIASWS